MAMYVIAGTFAVLCIEFRDVRGDVAMPWPAVFVHTFEDNHSYLEQNKDGEEQLLVGDSWSWGARA
jgi:hypothetical protein